MLPLQPSTMSPQSPEQNIKPLHNSIYETVAPNYKPRYAYLETGQQRPTGGHHNHSIMKRLFKTLCSCVSLPCLKKQVRRPIFMYITVASGVLVVLNRYLFVNTLDRNMLGQVRGSANIQSYGLFTNLSESQWSKMQEGTRQSRDEQQQKNKKKRWTVEKKQTWHTDFDCPKEQAVGVASFFDRGGGVTTCNASGIASASNTRSAKGQNGCLVYSSYHKPIDLKFEKAMLDVVGPCEIHVFNSEGLAHGYDPPKEYIHLHPWKLEKNSDDKVQMGTRNVKSLQDTIQYLGHGGMTVDLFVLDCAACELNTIDDWFDKSGSDARGGVEILQIIAKVHSGRHDIMEHFFKSILKQGYVTFHKGKLEHHAMRWYGFLKLAPEYFIR